MFQLAYHPPMPVFVDDKPVDLAGVNLAAMLESARGRLRDSGRVVVDVRLDGVALDGEELDRRMDEFVGDGELCLHTADPRDLSRSTLEMLLAQFDEVACNQKEIADLINRDELSEAMTRFADVMEKWRQSQEAIRNAAGLVEIDLGGLDVEGGTAIRVIEQVIERLKTMRDAIEARDFVGLADVLSYEGPDLVERWQKLILRIIEKIDQKS